MQNPLLQDIATYFTDNKLVEGDGIDTFRDFVPEVPDSLVAITEYKGSPAVHYDPSAHRSIQVSVRDKNADVARRKALKIYEVLLKDIEDAGRVDFTPERFGQVTLRQPPFRSKTDESDRVYYTFNMGITTSIY